MSQTVLPLPTEIIEVETAVVACDGGDGLPGGHPRVYLNVGKEGQIDCPYCSHRYVPKAGAAGGH